MEKKYSPEEIEELALKCKELAIKHYLKGLCCAEAVFAAWLDMELCDLPKEAVCMSTGLCGGFGALHFSCGAVSGGVIAIGTVKGRKEPDHLKDFDKIQDELHNPVYGTYNVFADYVKGIIKEWGTCDCWTVLNRFDINTEEGLKERRDYCTELVADCAYRAVKAALS